MTILSCVIPNYNDGHCIARAVETMSFHGIPCEIIIVDDRSTDDSLSVLFRLAEGDPRIRVISRSVNGGPFAAACHGVAHAAGRYVYLGSANDLVVPFFFQKAVSMLEQYPQAAFFASNACLVRNGQKTNSDLGWGSEERYVDSSQVLQENFRKVRSFHGQSIVMRKSAFPLAELESQPELYRRLGGMVDLFIFSICALRQGFCFSPAVFSEIVIDRKSFSARLSDKRVKTAAIRTLIEVMERSVYDDVRERLIQSGLLSFAGLRLFLVLMRDRRWDLVSQRLFVDFCRLGKNRLYSNILKNWFWCREKALTAR